MHRRLSKYITIILFYPGFLLAQVPSVNGDFEINTVRGCINLDVNVNNLTSPQPGEVVLYSYHGLNPDSVTSNTSYTYFSPGTYWVYQFIQTPSGGTGKADSVQVEVFDNPAPIVELLTCNNNVVIVDIQDSFYDIYQIDYGDGSPLVIANTGQAPAYSYASTGTYSISITGVYTTAMNTCGSTSLTFDPLIQVGSGIINSSRAISADSTVLNYTLAPNSLSYLEYSINSSSNFQTLKVLGQNTSIDTLSNLDLNANTYCFRVATYDACSNFRAYSNIVCTVNLDANAVNNAINLSWTTDQGIIVSNFNIERDGVLLSSQPGSQISFSDSTVQCGVNYCYSIQAQYSNGSSSTSLLACATAFSTDQPQAPTEISSTRNTDNTVYNWLPTTGNNQTYIFALQNGSYQVIDSTNQNTYTISPPEACIRLANANGCGLSSPLSSVACPMMLTATAFETGNVALNWSEPSGWSVEPNNYAVVIYNEDLSIRDSVVVGNQLFYIDLIADAPEQFAFYVVYAISPDPNVVPSRSDFVPLVRTPQILLPNTFTPNQDGLNDLFQVNGKFIDSSQMSIFNRWGSMIHYSGDSSGWDGSSEGKKVPLGNYTYKVVVKDFTGNEHIRTGSILILSH